MTNTQQVVVFGRGEKPMVAALIQGAATAGLRPILQRPHLDAGSALVLPGVQAIFTDGIKGPVAHFIAAYKAAGVPVYIMELPRLRACLPDRNDYGETFGLYRDTLHHLPLALGNSVVVEGRLPERTPEYALLVGQKPNDTAHGMDAAAMYRWVRETARFVREQYGLPVVYRPHPKDSTGIQHIPYVDDVRSNMTLREELANAAVLVTYNSTAGVEAIDAGVPVLYGAPASMVCYADYAQRLGQRIEPLTEGERRTFLMRCGATQWTLDQIREGIAMQVLCNGASYPEPELVEPSPEPVVPEEKPTPSPARRNRAMSREVVPNGR